MLTLRYSAVSTYMDCPSKWYYRYILGLDHQSASAARGSKIHAEIEAYYKRGVKPTHPVAQALIKLSPAPTSTILSEFDLTPHLPQGWIGTADLVDWDNPSRIDLYDYKTTSGLHFLPDTLDAATARPRDTLQGFIYARALLDKFPAATTIRVIQLQSDTSAVTRKVWADYTRDQISQFWSTVIDPIVSAMRVDYQKPIEQVTYTLSACSKYNGCPYKDRCKLITQESNKMATLTPDEVRARIEAKQQGNKPAPKPAPVPTPKAAPQPAPKAAPQAAPKPAPAVKVPVTPAEPAPAPQAARQPRNAQARLGALGYSAEQFQRMTVQTMKELLDAEINAGSVSILADGSWQEVDQQVEAEPADDGITPISDKQADMLMDLGWDDEGELAGLDHTQASAIIEAKLNRADADLDWDDTLTVILDVHKKQPAPKAAPQPAPKAAPQAAPKPAPAVKVPVTPAEPAPAPQAAPKPANQGWVLFVGCTPVGKPVHQLSKLIQDVILSKPDPVKFALAPYGESEKLVAMALVEKLNGTGFEGAFIVADTEGSYSRAALEFLTPYAAYVVKGLN